MPRLGARFVLHSALCAGGLLASASVAADRTVLHEYFEPNDAEDLLFQATTLDGSMPVAIETPSGLVPAPDTTAAPNAPEKAYGGGSTPDSADAEYRVDRNTARPDLVSYDDPFNPSVAPFKRLYAYDAVDAELELAVADKRLTKVTSGGAAQAGDDQFFGVVVVDLVRDVPVRIPTVGPGSRLLSAQTAPPIAFEILRDGADNWYMRAAERRRVRLTVLLAISRDVFGSSFADVSYGDLPPPAALPPRAVEATRRALDRIGIGPALAPKHALELLVTYFRGFAPSTDLPRATDPLGLYEELVESQKGVCRHRAYAFTLTALGLGLPTRMVRNEAHAWVEVSDGRLWHRIDLGGAAGELDLEARESGLQHVPPTDPFPWPPDAQSGEDMAERARRALGLGESEPREPRRDPLRPFGGPTDADTAGSGRPPSTVEVVTPGGDVRRGEPLAVAGRVTVGGRGCEAARVDVALVDAHGVPLALGSLPTDDDGRFSGSVAVRLDLEVGDYQLLVTTPGTARCGPGRSQD